jgi:hypothetical protein
MPRVVLAPMLANPDAALVSVVPSTVESLRLLTSYIGLLIHDPPLMERAAELRRLAVSQFMIWLPWLLELRATLRRSRLDVVCVRRD